MSSTSLSKTLRGDSRYFLKISYLGTYFLGWQSQKNETDKTVQSTLQTALTMLAGHTIELVGCGRTDAGVHAAAYYAHFDWPVSGRQWSLQELLSKLNKMVGPYIAIEDCIPVDRQAHARFDALSRSYTYKLTTRKDPFMGHQAYYYPKEKLNINLLNEAAHLLLMHTDFNTFCKTHTDVHTTICHISKSVWTQEGHIYAYDITANRFLRGMIRLVVGMCLNVERKKLTLEEVHTALKNKQRTGHDWSVPPEGLTLHSIQYAYI